MPDLKATKNCLFLSHCLPFFPVFPITFEKQCLFTSCLPSHFHFFFFLISSFLFSFFLLLLLSSFPRFYSFTFLHSAAPFSPPSFFKIIEISAKLFRVISCQACGSLIQSRHVSQPSILKNPHLAHEPPSDYPHSQTYTAHNIHAFRHSMCSVAVFSSN